MRASFLNTIGAVAGIVLAGAMLVRGDILYQNTTVDTGINLNFANNQQIGQQIWLGSATPEYLTNFSFEYYSPVQAANFNGNVTMDVILYANDSPYAFHGYTIPGTILYNSGAILLATPFSQTGLTVATAIFDLSDLLNGVGPGAVGMTQLLPTNFTFSVTFSGLGNGDSVGLENYGYPTVGGNYGDYWFYGNGWELLTNATPTSFGAEFTGSTTIPEPTVLAMGALGAVMIAGFVRRYRK